MIWSQQRLILKDGLLRILEKPKFNDLKLDISEVKNIYFSEFFLFSFNTSPLILNGFEAS